MNKSTRDDRGLGHCQPLGLRGECGPQAQESGEVNSKGGWGPLLEERTAPGQGVPRPPTGQGGGDPPDTLLPWAVSPLWSAGLRKMASVQGHKGALPQSPPLRLFTVTCVKSKDSDPRQAVCTFDEKPREVFVGGMRPRHCGGNTRVRLRLRSSVGELQGPAG